MDDFVTPDVFAEAFGKPEQDGDAEIAGNDDDTPARWKRVRPSERDFMETCIEEVEAMSDEKALQRFCTNNDRSWVFWSSRRGNQPEKDQFMTRAVGLWWPWKMFEEMQGRSIVCPKCERSISRAEGTWVPLDEVREVISFSSTWLLLGREYRCPAANCNASFRNTGERFLKQCPELTRLRFSIILRRRLAIERAVAQFIHPLWVTNAQAAFDLLLGAHVREYERVREAYLLHWVATASPRASNSISNRATGPGLFTSSTSKEKRMELESASHGPQHTKEEAEKMINLEAWETICSKRREERKKVKAVVVSCGAGENGENVIRPIRAVEILEQWTDNFIGTASLDWMQNNVASLVKRHDAKKSNASTKKPKGQQPIKVQHYRNRMISVRKAVETYWKKNMQGMTVHEVQDLLREGTLREQRNEATIALGEQSRQDKEANEATDSRKRTGKAGLPPHFGPYADPTGYNGLRLSRSFMNAIQFELYEDEARPMLREIVSVPARVLRIDCTFNVARKVSVELRNENKLSECIQPFRALLTVVNEHSQACFYRGLRDGESLGRETYRALRSFKSMRETFDPAYRPSVIYSDKCCSERNSLQSIWKGTPVKLDAFRWLARWGPIMQVEKTHILRKLFIRAMSDALFVPDESLLREKTPNGDFCQMTRELRSEIPRKVPQPSILKERVRAVLIMFVNSDSLAERQNRINFLYRVCPSDTSSVQEDSSEDTLRALRAQHPSLENDGTNLLRTLEEVSTQQARKLFASKISVRGKRQTWESFVQTMMSHVTQGCLSDPEGVSLHTAWPCGRGFFTARGTNNNERLNMAYNTAFGNRSLGLVRADMVLLHTTARHNLSSTARLRGEPIDVYLQGSPAHRLRCNALVQEVFPDHSLPYSKAVLPVALDVGLELGLSLLPALGSRAQAESTSESTRDLGFFQLPRVAVSARAASSSALEMIWASLVSLCLQDSTLASITANSILKSSASESMASDIRGIFGAKVAARFVLEQKRAHREKHGSNPSESEIITSFVKFLATKSARKVILEVVEVDNDNNAVQERKIESGKPPQQGRGRPASKLLQVFIARLGVSISSVSATGNWKNIEALDSVAASNATRQRQASASEAAQEGADATDEGAFAHSEAPSGVAHGDSDCLPNVHVTLYDANNAEGHACWVALASSFQDLLRPNREQESVPLSTLPLTRSAPASWDPPAQPSKRPRGVPPLGKDALTGSLPLRTTRKGADKRERAEQDLFRLLQARYGFEVDANANSEKSFTKMALMWNSIVNYPVLLGSDMYRFINKGLRYKNVSELRDYARFKCQHSQIPFDKRRNPKNASSELLMKDAMSVEAQVPEEPVISAAQQKQLQRLNFLLANLNPDLRDVLLQDIFGRHRHLGSSDDIDSGATGLSPLRLLHKMPQVPIGTIASIVEASNQIAARAGQEWRTAEKLSSRLFCSSCKRRRLKKDHEGVPFGISGGCTLDQVIYTRHALCNFPRRYFEDFPVYTVKTDGELSAAQSRQGETFKQALAKICNIFGDATDLVFSLARAPSAAYSRSCIDDPEALRVSLLQDLVGAGPTQWVSNTIVDVFMKVLAAREHYKPDSISRRAIFVYEGGCHFDEHAWRVTLKRWSKSGQEFEKMFDGSPIDVTGKAEIVIKPVLHGAHWGLIYLDLKSKALFVYDPRNALASQSNFTKKLSDCAISLRKVVLKSEGEPVFRYGFQGVENNTDCGIFVMGVINALLTLPDEVDKAHEKVQPKSGHSTLDNVRSGIALTFADILNDAVNLEEAKVAETRDALVQSFIQDQRIKS